LATKRLRSRILRLSNWEMSENGNIGLDGSRSAVTSAEGETSGLDVTVPVPGAVRSESELAVDTTVRIPSADFGADSGADAEETLAPDFAASDDLCGRTLQHFEVLECIGVGGMGSVYRAHDLSLDRTVALKVIRSEKVAAAAQRERFVREARSQARLSHPNVVPIYFIGEDDGLLFFAMELVEGEPLDALLARGEQIEWPRALELLHDVADALRMAHERDIVHRDIKPSNLLVDPTGLVKVADFGLAKNVSSGDSTEGMDVQLTQAGAVLGSPLYMSPEQGQGEAVDHRSDIYSLGATFYHLLTGNPPFTAKSPVGVIAKHLSAPVPPLCKALPTLPEGVARLVERMLAKDPADRFSDYDELMRAVRATRPNAIVPAGVVVRAIAFGVDLIPLLLLVALLDWAGMAVFGLYLVLGWWRFGQTLGKWLFKLRVRTVDNQPLPLWRCVIRAVLLFWGPLAVVVVVVISRSVFGVWGIGNAGPDYAGQRGLATLFVLIVTVLSGIHVFGLAWAGLRRHKRAWHDLLSGTMVVYHLPSAGSGSEDAYGEVAPGLLSRSSSSSGR
jgi:tRNA A-37 threonylcarbamoyl transferase component Bud32/uncharacterized RDD family membrane protein YckC